MDSLYPLVLGVHSWLRWIVLVAGVLLVLRAAAGVFGKREWMKADRGALLAFVLSMDLQLVVGLVLYIGVSPVTRTALADMPSAMKDPTLRFFAVEHGMMMMLALILLHVGNVLVKKSNVSSVRFKRALIFGGLALLLILAGIPWPGSATHPRPLFFGW